MQEQQDLFEDLSNCQWFLDKIRASETYAQNVYAAMCNIRWQKAEVWPVLKDEYWSVSWRSAGGIVAQFQGRGGDYMDWYCSGMGSGLGNGDESGTKGYVGEGTVTYEVLKDFATLGWHPSEWPKDED